MFPRSGRLLADSKSNSSTRLPLKTTTRVSSGWEASMIILLAMINSLAARESSLRGPTRPPDRAARGVYAGDGEILGPGDARRRIGVVFRREQVAKKHPRRPNGGRRFVVLPSEHRQPENKTWPGAPPSTGAAWRRTSRSEPRPGHCPAGDSGFRLQSRRGPSPELITAAGDPTGRPTRPGVVRATRRPPHDGPGERLTQLKSKPATRTRSEFATRHK